MNAKLTIGQIIICALIFLGSFFSIAYLAEWLIFANLSLKMESEGPGPVQVYWDNGNGFSESDSYSQPLISGKNIYNFSVPVRHLKKLRIDPCRSPSDIRISSISISWFITLKRWDAENRFTGWSPGNEISDFKSDGQVLALTAKGEDPSIIQRDVRQVVMRVALIRIFIAALLALILTAFAAVKFSNAFEKTVVSFDSGAFSSSPNSYSGPLILLLTLLIMLPIGYLVLRNISAEAPITFEGSDGEYKLSFVSTTGDTLSKQRGHLRLVIDPFTVYRNFPSQESSKYTIDKNGFRGGYDPAKQKRIIALGGSSTFGQDLDSDSDTFSFKLQEMMPEYAVINAGVVGFLSGQELAYMVHYLDNLKPEGYIAFDGWNDLFDQYISLKRKEGQFGYNNTFFIIEDRLAEYAKTLGELEPTATNSMDNFSDEKTYLQRIRETYSNNLIKMSRFAASRGAFFLVVFQPELSIKKLRSEKEERYLKRWEKRYNYIKSGFQEKYRQMIEETKKVLIEESIPFIDLEASPTFVDSPDELYNDVVHLNVKGNELVAQALQRKISTLKSE